MTYDSVFPTKLTKWMNKTYSIKVGPTIFKLNIRSSCTEKLSLIKKRLALILAEIITRNFCFHFFLNSKHAYRFHNWSVNPLQSLNKVRYLWITVNYGHKFIVEFLTNDFQDIHDVCLGFWFFVFLLVENVKADGYDLFDKSYKNVHALYEQNFKTFDDGIVLIEIFLQWKMLEIYRKNLLERYEFMICYN